MSEPWLGHWDGCSIQWSSVCDCDPGSLIDLGERDTCHPVEVDGETVCVRGSESMDERDREMFAEIVRAAKRRYEAEHPEEATDEPRT